MRSTDPQDYQTLPQPVAAMAKEFPDGFRTPPHAHPRAQLLHAIEGVMRVTVGSAAWIVPPGRAVWIPANTIHDLAMAGTVAMRTLYITPDALAADRERLCRVIDVSPLLRALILALIEEPLHFPVLSRADLISRLILIELSNAPAVPLHLPMPTDGRLLTLCRFLLDHPACHDTLDDWAARLAVSPRTVARQFSMETGMSFAAWRQQVRLSEALCRLARGETVKKIAYALGYRSPSAFIAMFRRTLGQSPMAYRDQASVVLPQDRSLP